MLIVLIFGAGAWSATLSPYFLTASNLASLTGAYVPTGILALGLLLVIVAGEIDISFVSNMVLSAICFGLLWQAGVNVWIAAFIGIITGIALGLLIGILVGRVGLPSLAITLGTLAAYSGLASAILGGDSITGFPDGFTAIGLGSVGIVPVPVLIFAGVAVVAAFVLHTTRFGRYVYAIGANREAARLSGIPVRMVVISLFGILGALAAGSGLVYTASYSIRADAGVGLLLTAITIVVLGGADIFGGKGSVVGTVLAFVLICLLRNGMQLANVTTNEQDILIGALMIVAILIGGNGSGRGQRERLARVRGLASRWRKAGMM